MTPPNHLEPCGRIPAHRVTTALACVLVMACGGTGDSPDAATVASDAFVANYDEALVPEYTLPDPLVMLTGAHVTDVESWSTGRRPEILALFEEHVFGTTPAGPFETSTEVLSAEPALAGVAIRKLPVRLYAV